MSRWGMFKSAARSVMTGTTMYWMRNGDVVSVCVNVSGSDANQMAEEAENKACGIARKIGSAGLLDSRVFMHSNGKGLEAVSMVDVPWSPRAETELARFGLVEAV